MALPITIDANGIHAPTFAEILADLQASYRLIYGADAYLDPDSQDGQLLGIFALAISDSYAGVVAAYNSFSPATAQGVGLSSKVKINGLTRLVSSLSTVDLTLVGQAGATIVNGKASDGVNKWLLPALVIIPDDGEIIVTASASETGALAAAINTITIIDTPTLGWQTVNNASAATPGAPVESDAALRLRQSVSTMLPARTVLEGVTAAVAQVAGVVDIRAYENDTNATDANTLPEHSISLVVDGGDALEIQTAILLKKTPGAFTYGDVSNTFYVDFSPLPTVIAFYRPIDVPLLVSVTLEALAGYSTAVGDKVKQSLVDHINALGIGQTSYLGRLYTPANLPDDPDGFTYEITSLLQSISPASPAAANIVPTFKQRLRLTLANVSLTVT